MSTRHPQPDDLMIAEFRLRMPAFSDVARYPDEQIRQALCEGIRETSLSRWGRYRNDCGNFRQRGIFYFTAHYIDIFWPNGTADGSNATSGTRLNPASKSVGDESIAYRISAMQDAGDDWLSTTNYGVMFLRLRRRAAAGMVAV